MERLAREKISAQQRLAVLKKEISSHYDNVDFSKFLPDVTTTTQNPSGTTDTVIETRSEVITTTSSTQVNGGGSMEKVTTIPILAKTSIPIVTQAHTSIKEVRFLVPPFIIYNLSNHLIWMII